MGWIARLLANREARRLALSIAHQLADGAEELDAGRVRNLRPAQTNDLADSLAKFRLARTRGQR